MTLSHLSLCAGVGGFELAAEAAGFENQWFCEIDDAAAGVLHKNFPGVKRIRDIRDVNKETVPETPTLITAGFPCQPYSNSGQRLGKEDDRDLWPEVLRVLRELQPTWFVGENVSGFVKMELDPAIVDLENIGYEVQPFVIPACAVDAPSERARVFIVAHTLGSRPSGQRGHVNALHSEADVFREASDVIDAFQRGTLPYVCRRHNGVPSSVDRLKQLGNALVWLQVFPILEAISIIEGGCDA